MWEKKARREREEWEIMNRERKGSREINGGIEMEDWRKYFMGMLGGWKAE